MRLVVNWLRELVAVPDDAETIAREISLRGFEVASIEHGPEPVIDFEITANRPDCLSHLGFAREASAIWSQPLTLPAGLAQPLAADGSTRSGPEPRERGDLGVELEDAELCPRYCAQVFEVRIGPSPSAIQDRLAAAGVRPISNIVDLTNYVMLEIGQPMHAFDFGRLAERRLVIRRARAGETLTTLDGMARALDPEMLVIADGDRASAIAGVMGGRDSEIGGATTRVALESAYFQPASVRRTSKRLGLKTEASTRFERGANVNAPPLGLARFAALLTGIGAGAPVGGIIDRYPAPRPPAQIRLRASRIARVLGAELPAADVPRILEPLGFTIASTSGDGPERAWDVIVPSFRVDVTREVDLIEEAGRHYGFGRLPTTFPALDAAQQPPDPEIARTRLFRQVCTAAGFSESMTFAFIERQAALPFCDPGSEPAAIANPLSEKFAVLRPSLIPGLIDSAAHNRRRGRRDVQLFETGSRVSASGEGRAVALAWCGAAVNAHWSGGERAVDFFDLTGAVEQILAAFGIADVEFAPLERRYLVRGRAAELRAAGSTLGVVGQLAPAIGEPRGFPPAEALYVAEMDADAIGRLAPGDALRTVSLPRFPSIVRDISVVVDEALPAAAVRGTIRRVAPATLVSIAEFDRYQGSGIPDGRVSLSLRLTFQALDRTLTDDEAQAATDRILARLGAEHGAEQR